MEGHLFQADEFFEIGINGKIDPILVDRALLYAPRRIAQVLSDISDGKFDALLFERVRQQPQSALLHGAFAGITIGERSTSIQQHVLTSAVTSTGIALRSVGTARATVRCSTSTEIRSMRPPSPH